MAFVYAGGRTLSPRLVLLSVLLGAVCLAPSPLNAQTGAQALLPNFEKGPSQFPNLIAPYKAQPIPPLMLENSPRLRDLIHDGKMELSVSDALALALENNLNIAVQRFLRPIAQVDVLRTQSGQAARGIPGALLPAGLSVGAIGVGVNQFQGANGVGSAGGISGGGGAVQVPQLGSFDPSVTLNGSWDRTVSPLNTTTVAGVPQVTTYSTALTGTYTQLLPDGTSFLFSMNAIRQSSTQQHLIYNPAVITRFSGGFNQPLLNGFGFLPNKRFMMVAQNDIRTSEELFRQQVTAVVVQVTDAYWDLAAARQAVAAAERSREAARTLFRQTQTMQELGTAAALDVATASASLATGDRDLIIAQTNFQFQQAQLKNMLSKTTDAQLDAAEIVTTDQLPEPSERDVPQLQPALETAFRQRPDLLAPAQDLKNQEISVGFTKNGLLPSLSVFGLYAGAGLAGNTLLATAGTAESLQQDFVLQYPEYAGGVSAVVPIRNRSAQADNLRARLERRQLQVNLQNTRQQVSLEVRQAIIGLIQGRAQVESSHEAVKLANQTADAERKKLQVGLSTAYNVILRDRDVMTALQADIAAVGTYAKALVEMDRSMGATLESNGIELEEALSGDVTKQPTPSLRYPRYTGVPETKP
ncbi:MAG TPA: TolC family protein [Bryobacteraceae bacterium]|nr:TolC family protein [Bryobacteraceae bacterium]